MLIQLSNYYIVLEQFFLGILRNGMVEIKVSSKFGALKIVIL